MLQNTASQAHVTVFLVLLKVVFLEARFRSPLPPQTPPSPLVARGGQGPLRSRGPWPRGTRGPGPLSWKASNGHTIGADTTVPALRSLLSNSWLRNFHGFRIMVAFAILELTRVRWHQIVATITFRAQFCFRMV